MMEQKRKPKKPPYYKHLTWTDRLKIEKMLNEKRSVAEIARALRTTVQKVYREIKNG